MKKHIRHKKAKPHGTMVVNYADPNTGVVYARERFKVKDFYNLIRLFERLYGEKVGVTITEGELWIIGMEAAIEYLKSQEEVIENE